MKETLRVFFSMTGIFTEIGILSSGEYDSYNSLTFCESYRLVAITVYIYMNHSIVIKRICKQKMFFLRSSCIMLAKGFNGTP